MDTYTIDIRPKRQTTLPKPVLEKVGLSVGDKLLIRVEDNKIILEPQKKIALDALQEIERIVRVSGISETVMQKETTNNRLKAA